ncbi:MAG: helix-turn-helix domain-containing protein [Candidatus Aenigmarchaeota archaeon]|nr:helix-turn-helix domain-containing protein [Candidatus Aenigmarchaeota archaeon]
MAKELNACGMNQKEVADVLGISQPAVSQYLRDLRGARNHFSSDEELLSRVKDVCGRIVTKEIYEPQLKKEMYEICEAAMNKRKV